MRAQMSSSDECNRGWQTLTCNLVWVAIRNATEDLAPKCDDGTCSPAGEHRDVHCINGAVKYLPSYYLYDYNS